MQSRQIRYIESRLYYNLYTTVSLLLISTFQIQSNGTNHWRCIDWRYDGCHDGQEVKSIRRNPIKNNDNGFFTKKNDLSFVSCIIKTSSISERKKHESDNEGRIELCDS